MDEVVKTVGWTQYWRVRCKDCSTDDGPFYASQEPDSVTLCWPCMTERMVAEERK